MTNPTLNFTYADWKSQTAKLFAVRSAKLRALDVLVDSYIRTPSDNNLRFLKRGFHDWKSSKGDGEEWFTSRRNDKHYHAITNLNAMPDRNGDTGTAFGVIAIQTNDMISVTSGALDLAGAGIDLAGGLSESSSDGMVQAGLRPGARQAPSSARRHLIEPMLAFMGG